MSAELETLDQLAGGDLHLAIIRQLYLDDNAFTQGVAGLLSCGDVRLLAVNGSEVPDWRWRELFQNGEVLNQLDTLRLTLTGQGATKV